MDGICQEGCIAGSNVSIVTQSWPHFVWFFPLLTASSTSSVPMTSMPPPLEDATRTRSCLGGLFAATAIARGECVYCDPSSVHSDPDDSNCNVVWHRKSSGMAVALTDIPEGYRFTVHNLDVKDDWEEEHDVTDASDSEDYRDEYEAEGDEGMESMDLDHTSSLVIATLEEGQTVVWQIPNMLITPKERRYLEEVSRGMYSNSKINALRLMGANMCKNRPIDPLTGAFLCSPTEPVTHCYTVRLYPRRIRNPRR